MSFWKSLVKGAKKLVKGVTGGDLFTAGAGLVSSIFGNKSSKKAQESANQTNLQIAGLTNDTNRAIADATNAMNLKIMRENNAWSAEQALKMFNLENQYNSPAAQMQRLAFAGLNPSVAMAGSLGSAMSTPANGSAPVGQPISAVTGAPMQAAHVEPVYNRSSTLESFNAIANVISSVSGAFKNTAEGKSILKKLDAELNNILADTKFKQVQEGRENLQLQLDKIFAKSERRSSLRRLDNEARKLFNEATLARLKGDTEKWNTKIAEFETTLKHYESQLSGESLAQFQEQRPILLENLRKEGELIDEKIRTEGSQQVANRASANASNAAARASNAQANQISALTPYMQGNIESEIRQKDFNNVCKALELIFKANGVGESILTQIPTLARNLIDKNVLGNDLNQAILDVLQPALNKKFVPKKGNK